METKAVFICIVYVLTVSLLQFIFYGEDIINVDEPKPVEIDIPIIGNILGGIANFFAWCWYVVNIFVNVFTFNIPELPLIVRIFFSVPFWACWGYLLVILITKIVKSLPLA